MRVFNGPQRSFFYFTAFGRPVSPLLVRALLSLVVVLAYIAVILTFIQPTMHSTPVKQGQTLGAQDNATSAKPAATTPVAADQGSRPVQEPAPVRATTPPAAPNCHRGTAFSPSNASLVSAGVNHSPPATVYYAIYGNTVAEIRQQMVRCTPVATGHAAETAYLINWQYGVSSYADGLCRLTDVRVGLSQGYTYPQWNSSPNSVAGVANEWQRFISALTLHEQGHGALNVQSATRMASDLQAFSSTDCATIAAQANSLIQTRLQELRNANASYDHATGHGATQGATL